MRENYTADQILGFAKDYWPQVRSPAHEFVVYLNRVRDLGFSRAREAMAGYNLSPGEFDILVTLRCTAFPHVLKPAQLQQSVLITSGGLTKLLYQLEARGLVRRSVQAQDKRSKLVHLTAKGKKLIERATRTVMQADRKWLDEALTGRELEQLKKLLGKLARALEARK
jgi:DNA-binding MarR family transcriptional regulator